MTFFTILHVDDDVSSLQALKRQLRKEPYQLISIQDSSAAVMLAKQIHFDLAILDVSMPGMNGFKLSQELHFVTPNLPVLLLTGLVEDFVLYRIGNAECDGFLQKTCDPITLKKIVRKLVQKHKSYIKHK